MQAVNLMALHWDVIPSKLIRWSLESGKNIPIKQQQQQQKKGWEDQLSKCMFGQITLLSEASGSGLVQITSLSEMSGSGLVWAPHNTIRS